MTFTEINRIRMHSLLCQLFQIIVHLFKIHLKLLFSFLAKLETELI